jgi:hypothetical protein
MAVETSGVANSSQQLQLLAARSQLLVTAHLPGKPMKPACLRRQRTYTSSDGGISGLRPMISVGRNWTNGALDCMTTEQTVNGSLLRTSGPRAARASVKVVAGAYIHVRLAASVTRVSTAAALPMSHEAFFALVPRKSTKA